MSKSIILKNYLNVFEELVSTAVAVIPGMLLELESTGKVQAHSTAGGNVLPMFAKEDAMQGKAITDAYVASDRVQVWIAQRGDQAYAILADDNSIAIGDYLESNGAGFLQKHSADSAGVVEYPLAVVAQALEAVDLTGDSSAESSASPLGVNKRIKVRIV